MRPVNALEQTAIAILGAGVLAVSVLRAVIEVNRRLRGG